MVLQKRKAYCNIKNVTVRLILAIAQDKNPVIIDQLKIWGINSVRKRTGLMTHQDRI